jgi:hypothetical protein
MIGQNTGIFRSIPLEERESGRAREGNRRLIMRSIIHTSPGPGTSIVASMFVRSVSEVGPCDHDARIPVPTPINKCVISVS